jgi:hypothetical protein
MARAISLVAVALFALADSGLASAQAVAGSTSGMTAPPAGHIGQAPPPAPAPPPTPSSVSRLRFEPRPEIPAASRPAIAPFGLRGRSFIFVPVYPFVDVTLFQTGGPQPPLAVPSESGLRGGVQLDVQPWQAQVYVDGTYAGLVEEFRGYYRHLEVVAGPHVITILAPHYEPLILNVIVPPGDTITYRGTLSAN